MNLGESIHIDIEKEIKDIEARIPDLSEVEKRVGYIVDKTIISYGGISKL